MAYKYVNDQRLQESLEAIRDRLVIKDKTEAQALVASASYPHCVYYTSDTHKIVVGGNVYCDIESIGETVCGEIIAEIFGEGDFGSSYEFAADTSGQANWDTSKIYYVPSSTAGMYNIYSYSNGAWSYTQSSSSPIPAANISYDRTNTPDLGNGNVQSAVEAVDWKHTLVAGKNIRIYQPLPDGYTRVEWLQGSYTAYINTGIAGGKDTLEIECEYSYSSHTSYSGIYGNYVDENTNCWRLILRNTDDNGCLVNYNTKASGGNTYIANINTKNEFHTVISNSEYFIFDGVVYDVSKHTTGTTNNNTIRLFAQQVTLTSTNNINLKVKRFIIRDEGVEVLNLIPCRRNSDNALGMYDVVNGSFLTKQGSGSFSAGADVPPNEIMGVYDDVRTNFGADTLQDAIEAEDAKVEQLSLDVLGEYTDGSTEEYWEDMQYEKYHTGYGGQNQNAYVDGTNPTTLAYNASSVVQFFKVEEGEVYHIKGTKAPNTHYKVAFYNSWNPKTGSNGGTISSTFISGIKSTNSSTIQDFKVTVPEGAMMMVIGTVQNNTYKYYQTGNTVELYRKVNRQPMSIADKIGRLITEWSEDSVISGTAVGGNVYNNTTPITADTQYGGRVAKVYVNEGDKLLIDAASFYTGSILMFFDNDGNCISTPNGSNKRILGVYTAPCDGFAYIRDVLHRDCYIYNKAHGYLAYQALDALRNAKVVDYPNEFAPSKLSTDLPKRVSGTLGGSATSLDTIVSPHRIYRAQIDSRTPVLLIGIHLFVNEGHTAGGTWGEHLTQTTDGNNVYKTLQTGGSSSMATIKGIDGGMWRFNVILSVSAAAMVPYVRLTGMTAGGNYDYTVDRIFGYYADTVNDACKVILDISNNLGNITNEGFTGGMSSIALQSVSLSSILGLGYDITACLQDFPIDTVAFQNGVALYNSGKPTGSWYTKYRSGRYYFPKVDTSAITSLGGFGQGNMYLYCLPDLDFSGLNSGNSMDNFCYQARSLKWVGNLDLTGCTSLYRWALAECYSLLRVGNLITPDVTNFYGLLHGSPALRRVESIDIGKGTNFTYFITNNGGNLRYLVLKNIGATSSLTTLNLSHLTNWGVPNAQFDDTSDARKSLINSLITYSFDRAAAEYSVFTITLSTNTKALLTTGELEQITAKGYTIA